MATNYLERRGQIEAYFDRTAVDAWRRLTSDAPVSRIRATVRAGRERMRATLLQWLPADLEATRLLDAGCGTGALSIEAARRGAAVTGIDLSPTLINIARERLQHDAKSGSITLLSGDMLDDGLGEFDHMVAMDSLIHYATKDVVSALTRLAPRCRRSLLFTFPPKTLALSAMHNVGKLFPRGDRSPSIQPQREVQLRELLSGAAFSDWQIGRTARIASGFYTSQALELVRR